MHTLIEKINRDYMGKLLSAALVAEIILFSYLLFELFYPFIPISFSDARFPIVAVTQTQFTYRLRGVKRLDIPAELDRALICESNTGKQLFNLPPAVSTTPPSSFDHVIDIEIPVNVKRPASCYMRETGTFRHSPFRDVIISMDTEEFVLN